MFVSVVLDPGGIDSAKAIAAILSRYSFKKIQKACWECMQINEAQLSALKREIDSVTDYYDTLRIYQFPVNSNFAITELRHKQWKRSIYGAKQN
ncbi:MAG: CRISPR-associated protein Cas2 [Treponema sp.]|nr:CRISPR-associated protein Cas2 [Treponema sp.]